MPRKRMGHLTDPRYEWVFTLDRAPACTRESQDWCEECRRQIEEEWYYVKKRYEMGVLSLETGLPIWSKSWRKINSDYHDMVKAPHPRGFGITQGLAAKCVWIRELKKLMEYKYEESAAKDIVEISYTADRPAPTGLKAHIAGGYDGWYAISGS